MGNKELRRGGVAREGGAKSEEGGARANLSSKESHISKGEPSLVKVQRVLLQRQEVCKHGGASAQFSHVLARVAVTDSHTREN